MSSSSVSLPTLPKSFMNEFGSALRADIERDMESLISSNISDDEARDSLFRKVSFCVDEVIRCNSKSTHFHADTSNQ